MDTDMIDIHLRLPARLIADLVDASELAGIPFDRFTAHCLAAYVKSGRGVTDIVEEGTPEEVAILAYQFATSDACPLGEFRMEDLYRKMGREEVWDTMTRGRRIMIGKAFSAHVAESGGRIKIIGKTAQNQALYTSNH